MEDFGLYLVMTDPAVGYERCCEAAVRAGVRMVQLRMKDAPRADVVKTASALMRITSGSETKLIVNDDPAAAAEAGADGVHVGQGDMPVCDVRRDFPGLGIVGLSTHNMVQALSIGSPPPDYIGVGPVYATPTKKIPDPTLGVANASRIIKIVDVPAVAIGGISSETLPGVIVAGARNWAVVRAVCASNDPYAAIRGLQAVAEETLQKM